MRTLAISGGEGKTMGKTTDANPPSAALRGSPSTPQRETQVRQCSKAGELDSKSDWGGSIPPACATEIREGHMHAWESVVEWLHKHPSRRIVIVAAGHYDEEGNWHSREGEATFELNTRLPDGRQVASRIQIRDEVMMEPLAGDMIVHNAKTAIEHLLSRGQSGESSAE